MSVQSVTLVRQVRYPQGILGTLTVESNGELFHTRTLELPWVNNERFVSCIPTGTYDIAACRSGGYFRAYKKRWDHKFSIAVTHPGEQNCGTRTEIRIHTGNAPRHTKGCILVGGLTGEEGGEPRVWESRDAYQALYEKLAPAFFGMECRLPFIIEDAKLMSTAGYQPDDDESEVENVDRGDL